MGLRSLTGTRMTGGGRVEPLRPPQVPSAGGQTAPGIAGVGAARAPAPVKPRAP